jgi:hypothetical protein
MESAWLRTPLDVYEKHVELESVGQAAAIRELLAAALERHKPESLAYLGCAGGNGLETAEGLRVVGLELNPGYAEAARARFPRAEIRVCDLNGELPEFEAVEMAFGALVFEYVADCEAVLRRVAERVASSGWLIVPVLEAGEGVPAVLPSPYLEQLAPLGQEYHALDAGVFSEKAARAGFRLESRAERPLPSGKRFVTLEFRRV